MSRPFSLAILARNVKTLRVAKEWNQTELAKKSGLSQKVISNLERAGELRIHPTIETLSSVADALGVPAFILLMPISEPLLVNIMQDKVSRLIDNYIHASSEGQAMIDRIGELESRSNR
jgi:transcriptional regulator with XRE-family HTH domain